MQDMHVDTLVNLPGGDMYEDVTDVFAEAAKDMDAETLIMTKTFSLLDAMSAFEIGEPRMDSGMITEPERRPPFDPLELMLPHEVCWILDRAFACEMEWHTGCSLTQTVYTLLYVHHLDDLNPDFIEHQHHSAFSDPQRPQELITSVLFASVMALLKSCDLSWREMSKGKVYDIEDWLGEKSEVSLLEGISADFILRKLDNAWLWLQHSRLPESDVQPLCDRVLLRKTILQLLKMPLPLDTREIRRLVTDARIILQRIRTQDVPQPHTESPARLAFDPRISRRLACFMPVRTIELPPQQRAWDTLQLFLDGWEELSRMLDTACVSTWEIAGRLRLCLPQKELYPAYLRSLTQSVVYDRGAILGRFQPTWLVDRFFLESVGRPYDTVLLMICTHNDGTTIWLKREIETRISKQIIADLKANGHNPPRRRRYLMRAVLKWHEIYDLFLQLVPYCQASEGDESAMVQVLTSLATIRRLTAAREVILSGFQQDLYAREEIPIAYWYLSRILDTHVECIDQIKEVALQEAYEEMEVQRSYLTALHAMSTAMSAVTYKQCTLPYQRTALNVLRRYKWAFKPEYDDLAPAPPFPDLRLFAPDVEGTLRDEHFSTARSFALAHDILDKIDGSRGFASLWADDRRMFFQHLARACTQLQALPSTPEELASFDSKRLKWVGRTHPWFPDLLQ